MPGTNASFDEVQGNNQPEAAHDLLWCLYVAAGATVQSETHRREPDTSVVTRRRASSKKDTMCFVETSMTGSQRLSNVPRWLIGILFSSVLLFGDTEVGVLLIGTYGEP